MTTKIENLGSRATLMDASNQWATRPADQRFTTLDELDASVASRRQRSFARDYDLNQLLTVQTGDSGMRIEANGRPLELTNWSFRQLAATVGAPAGYLTKLPAELAVRNLNHGLAATHADKGKRDGNKLLMIHPEDDDSRPLSAPVDPATLQAVTSPGYGRIWDADCVSLVRSIVRDHPEFHNPVAYGRNGGIEKAGLYASDHDVFMFMIDGGSRLEVGKDAHGNPDKLNRGFFLWNSETGAATFGVQTFLFREVCGNHIVWSASDITRLTIRHSKGGPGRFEEEALPAILDHVNRAASEDEAAILKAKSLLLPTDDRDMVALVSPFAITRSELRQAINVAKNEEGDCRNLWQLVQGLTAHARDMAHTDSRVDLERRAGKLMNLSAKSSLN